MKKPKIALVLSGGSSLGFAHVGVIDELTKAGIKPDIIVGTSMGAVVGGAYACGLTVDMMMKYAYKMSIFKFVDINFEPMGAFGGKKITDLLKHVYKDTKHSECVCKFATISADIITGEQVVLDHGNVIDSVRASMNIPGLLVPYKIDGRYLVDGGVINNYPDDVAKDLGADIVIGVDVLKYSFPKGKPKNFIVSLFKSMHILQNALYVYKKSSSDVTIEPNMSDLNMCDFKRKTVDMAIEIGRKECLKHLRKIKKVIKDWEKNNKDE